LRIYCLILMSLISSACLAQQSAPTSYEGVSAAPINFFAAGKTTILGQDYQLPIGNQLLITETIVIEPGQTTDIHSHKVPLYAFILSGELEVDYGSKGKKSFKAGSGFIEALNWCHAGESVGNTPVNIIGMYIGTQAQPDLMKPVPCPKLN